MKVLIVLPVYNEEVIIKRNCHRLLSFCQQNLTDDWQIVIADNASTDQTGSIVKKLAETEPRLIYFGLKEKGKGLAVKTAWLGFPADIYVFMDADLAVDLKSLSELINAIKDGSDIAIGSRRLPDSKVRRELFKKIISWSYNFLVRKLLKSKITDHPCGFKAVNRRVVKEILPLVKNNQWFFDTELLVLAERQGYGIKEIPVNWTEHKIKGRKSKVKLSGLIFDYLKEVWQLSKRLNHQ